MEVLVDLSKDLLSQYIVLSLHFFDHLIVFGAAIGKSEGALWMSLRVDLIPVIGDEA